jgi:type IV pilus assembly protein PilN
MFKKLVKIILNYLSKLTVEQEDVVGIDITPGCIRVAQLESSKKKWTLTKLGYKYIEVQGGYNAAKDLIDSNPQQYVNKLLQVLNSNKIKTKSAAVSIPVSISYTKVVNFPLMTDVELKEAVNTDSLWENAEQIDLPGNLDEYSIYWQVLKRETAENQMDILFVASKLDDIDKYLEVVRQAGLNPVVVDVRCFSIRNALELRKDLDDSDQTVTIVEFGAFENYILILHKNSPFIRDIFLSDKDRIAIFDQDSSDESLKRISERYAMQISQMLSTYQSQYKQPIESLLISSTMTNIDRVLGYLKESLPELNVEIFEPLKETKIPDNLKEKSTSELNNSIFSSVLGLATRKLDVFGYYEYVTGTNNINLLPNREKVKSQEKMKFLSRWSVVIFVLIIVALGAWTFVINLEETKEVDELMIEYNNLEFEKNEKGVLLSKLVSKKNELAGTLNATDNITSNQGFLYSVLLGINSSVPQDLSFSSIDYNGGDLLEINGTSFTDDKILTFIENLTKVKVIDRASLRTMSVQTINKKDIKYFTIDCVLAPQQGLIEQEKNSGN